MMALPRIWAWLMIVCDNVLHIGCNAVALKVFQ